jgi:hypothetical protein
MKWTYIAALILAIAFLGTMGMRSLRPATREADAVSQWRKAIAHDGASAAYQEFVRSVADQLPPQQHMHAHEFGDALYDEIGISGVAVCDEQFEQGCMHELVGRAVVDHGLSVLDELHDECNKALAPHSYYCQHAVGHALMTYFGPTDAGLATSLGYCVKNKADDPLHGCFTGAFMEYFERNVTTGEDNPRPVEEGNYLSVCPSLSEQNSAWLCYFSLPRWWRQLLVHAGQTELDAIPQLLAHCEAVDDPALRDACYAGVGEAVPRAASYDVQLAIKTCDEIAKSEHVRAICRAQAANDFLLVGYSPEQAGRLCTGLAGQSLAYCSAYANQLVQRLVTEEIPR